MKTNKEITYKGYTVPAGTRVTPMHRTGSAAEGPQKYWVDEFAWTEKATGFKDSLLKHDAVHYGIVVDAADVEI